MHVALRLACSQYACSYLTFLTTSPPQEAVGPGMLMENGSTSAMNVAIGDKVLLPEYGGTKIELEGEEKFLFREMDILGKFE